jgi:hypothetical protein
VTYPPELCEALALLLGRFPVTAAHIAKAQYGDLSMSSDGALLVWRIRRGKRRVPVAIGGDAIAAVKVLVRNGRRQPPSMNAFLLARRGGRPFTAQQIRYATKRIANEEDPCTTNQFESDQCENSAAS